MQALPMLRRREADTTSYVSDYLTRSVRRASGFVLAENPPESLRAPQPATHLIWRADLLTESGKYLRLLWPSS